MDDQNRTLPPYLGPMCIGSALALNQGFVTPFWVDALIRETSISHGVVGWISGAENLTAGLVTLLMLQGLAGSKRGMGLFGSFAIFVGSVVPLMSLDPLAVLSGRLVAGVGEGVLFCLVQTMGTQTRLPDRTFAIQNAAVIAIALALLFPLSWASAAHGAVGVSWILGIWAFLSVSLLGRLPKTRLFASAACMLWPRFSARAYAGLAVILLTTIAVQGLWVYAIIGGGRLAITPSSIQRAMGMAMISGVLGSVLAAILSGRLPRLPLIAFSLTMNAYAAWLFGFASSKMSFMFGICLLPLSSAILIPLIYGLLAQVDSTGRAAAIAPVPLLIGSAMGAPAVGVALQYGGYPIFLTANCVAVVLSFALTCYAGSSDRMRLNETRET